MIVKMAESSMHEIEWSKETVAITSIVDDLPTIVKVADGYYCENEAESFSNGDLIKLDFKRRYTKVKAQAIRENSLHMDEEEPGIVEEILIPFEYNGKLNIHCQKDTFYNMKELVEHFPRFVKVGKAFNAYKGKRWKTQTRILTDDHVELDREIPSMGLVCKVMSTRVLIPYDTEVLFHLIPDKKQYTVREIVEKFKMPQYVRFIESELQKFMTENLNEAIANISHIEGCFKITGVLNQEVLIGHHKPAGVSSQKTQRSIAILPLDSEVVQNLDVYLPVYEDISDYELMMVQNFSSNVNMDVVEGSLYLEFQKKPKVLFLPSSDSHQDIPPPRPPPPNASSRDLSIPKATPQRPDAPHFQDSDKAKTRRNPPQVPRSSKPKAPVKILTDPKADDFSDDDSDNPYEEIPEVHEIEEIKHVDGHSGEHYSKKTGLDFTKLPKTFRVGLKKVHHELKKLKRSHSTELKHPSTKENHILPSKDDLCLGEIRSSDDDDDGLVEYDYPDLTKLASMRRPPPSGDDPRYQSSPKPKPPKPVGKIQPMSHGTSDLMKFSDMTTGEVVDLFKQTMLPALASACEKEGLDGSFLSSLSDTQLKTVFKLSDLQLIKVNKIINDGWRPHIN
eukprot:XP_011454594.1 PREDICTED: uncharacterized protein LOC105347286 isoform X5 [Crassostrea gigas]